MSARDELDRALLTLAADGRRPRCGEPDDHGLWTSDDPGERARAARLCTGCPVLQSCAEAAEEEHDRWMVRGGVDRRPGRQARAALEGTKTPASNAGHDQRSHTALLNTTKGTPT